MKNKIKEVGYLCVPILPVPGLSLVVASNYLIVADVMDQP